MLCCHFLSIWCLPCATSLSDSASWQWPKGWEKPALPVSPPCRAGLAVTISHPATAQWRAQCQLWCSRQSSGVHPHEGGKTWYDVHRSPPKMRGQLCISCCSCQVWCVLVTRKEIGGWWQVSGTLMEESGWSGLNQVTAGHFYPFLRDFPKPKFHY